MSGTDGDAANDVGQLVASINQEVPQAEWTAWPGGWSDDIESALVDAVFSARAQYRTKTGRGVHALVSEWRQRRTRPDYSLRALMAEIDEAGGPEQWARAFGSSQHSPGRPATAPGGPTKAAAVYEAARELNALGVDRADDITEANAAQVDRAVRTPKGIGKATSNYLLMLLGKPGVKPDTMIIRFVERSTGRRTTPAQAEALVGAAASKLGVPAHELDHAIWAYESARAQDR